MVARSSIARETRSPHCDPRRIARCLDVDAVASPLRLRLARLLPVVWSDGRGSGFREPFADLSKLLAMAQAGETRIQLCGRFVVRLDGRRVEDALAGAKGQLLFVYLVLNRLRRIDRDELLIAVYGEEATAGHHPRLSVLLSKLRRVIAPELLTGRAQLELVLPAGAFVDVEAGARGATPGRVACS